VGHNGCSPPFRTGVTLFWLGLWRWVTGTRSCCGILGIILRHPGSVWTWRMHRNDCINPVCFGHSKNLQNYSFSTVFFIISKHLLFYVSTIDTSTACPLWLCVWTLKICSCVFTFKRAGICFYYFRYLKTYSHYSTVATAKIHFGVL